jgi:hypothetical protein
VLLEEQQRPDYKTLPLACHYIETPGFGCTDKVLAQVWNTTHQMPTVSTPGSKDPAEIKKKVYTMLIDNTKPQLYVRSKLANHTDTNHHRFRYLTAVSRTCQSVLGGIGR